jgi:hypothetical protein
MPHYPPPPTVPPAPPALVPFPPYTPDVFGPLIGDAEVRAAVKATIALWSGVYIAEKATQTGLTLKPIEDWKVLPEYRTLPIGDDPACWVTCLGTQGKPRPAGDGRIAVDYLTEVSVLVWGTGTWEDASDLVSHYATAVRSALVQHRALGGFATSTSWLGGKGMPVEHSSTRTLMVHVSHYLVTVTNTVNALAGPATPTSPTGSGPTVQTTHTSVNRTP